MADTKEKITEKIAELSETDNVSAETKIADLNMWDSLAIISLMLYAKDELNVKFSDIKKLSDAQTVGEICNLLESI